MKPLLFFSLWLSIAMTLNIVRSHLTPPHIISNPAKYQTQATRLLKEVSQRSRQEQEREIRKSYSKAVKEKELVSSNRDFAGLNESVVQLFARRVDCGPWSLFDNLIVTDIKLQEVCKIVESGGIAAESVRLDLDKWVSQQVYGKSKGLGAPTAAIEKLSQTLIQFKGLKPRFVQFGYKLLQEESSRCVSVVTRSASNSEQISSAQRLADLSPPDPIDIGELLSNNRNVEFLNDMKEKISTFSKLVISSNSKEVMICCDGSALMSGDRCMDASAGVIATPLPIETTDCGSNIIGGDNFLSMTHQLRLLGNKSLQLRVTDVGGMVTTPFDSEIVAGLAALAVACELHYFGISCNVFSDSRSLCRLSRRSEDGTTSSSTDQQSNRWQLDNLLKSLVERLSDGMKCRGDGNNSFKVEWTPGHPERRETDFQRWDSQDQAIWIADELAKSTKLSSGISSTRIPKEVVHLDASALLLWCRSLAIEGSNGSYRRST